MKLLNLQRALAAGISLLAGLSAFLLVPQLASAQQPDCSRYAERLDELDLFMRQNPTVKQLQYYQSRRQELVGGQAVCLQDQGFQNQLQGSQTNPAGSNTADQAGNTNATSSEGSGTEGSQTESATVITNTPDSAQQQSRPVFTGQSANTQQQVVIPQQQSQSGYNQQQAGSQQNQQPANNTRAEQPPRLPPGMSKEQYYQSLCKLARDTYEDDPSDRNRKKLARFCN